MPDTGLLCDLLWADPDKDVNGWAENDRGVSFTFGSDVVNKFLNKHDLGKKNVLLYRLRSPSTNQIPTILKEKIFFWTREKICCTVR